MPKEPPASFPTLGDFFDDARDLDLQAFIQRHGNTFFLHHGPLGALDETDEREKTVSREAVPGSGGAFSPQSDFLVFNIRPEQATQGQRPIRVGRGDTSDLVIPDASISHVHAHLHTGPKGGYFILDALSMNGTRVNDRPVPKKGSGDPVPLNSGDRIGLGSVNLTFLEASEFRTLILRLLAW